MCQYTSIYTRHARRGAAALISMGVLAACHAGSSPSAQPTTSSVIAISHVAVVDPRGGKTQMDATIIVDGARIRSVLPSSSASIPAGATVVDARGTYAVPGLWDMHVHLTTEGAWALEQYLAHGVTGVRDMGGRFETLDSLRWQVLRGERNGPRMLLAGPMIENADAMRGILAHATAADSAAARRDRLQLDSPAVATRAVDSLARLGVDMIKARDYTDAQTYWAIASAARHAHLPLVGHAPFGTNVDAEAIADSGQRSMEHWYYPDELFRLPPERYKRIVAAYALHGTALVPTIGAWRQHRFTVDSLTSLLDHALADPRAADVPAELVRHWRVEMETRRTERNGRPSTAPELAGWNRVLDSFGVEIGKLSMAGVPIVAGSDLPFARYPGEALQEELIDLVREAGLTPRQAIASATLAAARMHHMDDSLGVIARGNLADVVLLDADPLAAIENVRRVRAVMKDGRWVWRR